MATSLPAGRIVKCLMLSIVTTMLLQAPKALTKSKDEKLKQGIVQILVHAAGVGVDMGAGIVVGEDSANVYIATALHVLLGEDYSREIDSIKVGIQLYGALKDTIKGDPIRIHSQELDLAVVKMNKPQRTDFKLPALMKGNTAKVKERDEVMALGHPSDVPWSFAQGRIITTAETTRIQLSGEAVFPGHSGGGLFNAKRHLIGMILQKTAEKVYALKIEDLLSRLNEWGVPHGLQQPKSKLLYFGAGTLVAAGGVIAFILSRNDQQDKLPDPPSAPGGN